MLLQYWQYVSFTPPDRQASVARVKKKNTPPPGLLLSFSAQHARSLFG
jgi:hypothetical protein